jgi:hypothetical protein
MRWQDVQSETTVETKPTVDVNARNTTPPPPPPQPVQPTPAKTESTHDNKNVAKKKTTTTADDSSAEEDDEDTGADGDKAEHAHRKYRRDSGDDDVDATKAPTKVSADVAGTTSYESDEVLVLSGAVGERRRVRFAAALDGGISVAHGATVGMGALALRADYGGTTRVGGEASLWVVDGFHAQGLVGLYVGQLFGHLELDVGGDAHFGGGIGPSLELALRYYISRRFDVHIREDLGVLFDAGTSFVDSTTSAGLELSW